MEPIDIRFLDHVAIRVKDLEVSASWYQEVLGLKKYQLKEWGPFPIFMLAGKSGVALFPIKKSANTSDEAIGRKTIDHFAFNVDRDNFEKAKTRFELMGIDYSLQDHHYFYSIYIKDPDDHTVELTTIMVDENLFYREQL